MESTGDNLASHSALPGTFLESLRGLEGAYLTHSDPIRQSGFGGGAERWRSERSPILEAVDSDGDFLDVGCANGYLLECLVEWARERGVALIPYGLDQGAQLISLARQRLHRFADHFFVGNAWDWEPPRRFRYVYTLCDCAPEGFREEYLRRLMRRAVAPGGRLIVGAYGSRSRSLPPLDVARLIRDSGLPVSGTAEGGDGPITRFAWTENLASQDDSPTCDSR